MASVCFFFFCVCFFFFNNICAWLCSCVTLLQPTRSYWLQHKVTFYMPSQCDAVYSLVQYQSNHNWLLLSNTVSISFISSHFMCAHTGTHTHAHISFLYMISIMTVINQRLGVCLFGGCCGLGVFVLECLLVLCSLFNDPSRGPERRAHFTMWTIPHVFLEPNDNDTALPVHLRATDTSPIH